MRLKLFPTLFCTLLCALNIFALDSTFTSPFRVDDFDEGSTNVVVSAQSSNTNVVSSVSVVGSGAYRSLSFTPNLSVNGSSIITVDLADTGVISERTAELSALPGSSPSLVHFFGSRLSPDVASSSGQVFISWTGDLDKKTDKPYIINRSKIPFLSGGMDSFETVGYTFGTSFLDTNVVNDTQYYYIITWINNSSPVGPAGHKTYQFTFKSSKDLPLNFVISNTLQNVSISTTNLIPVVSSAGTPMTNSSLWNVWIPKYIDSVIYTNGLTTNNVIDVKVLWGDPIRQERRIFQAIPTIWNNYYITLALAKERILAGQKLHCLINVRNTSINLTDLTSDQNLIWNDHQVLYKVISLPTSKPPGF